ncbi:MAG: helix-turn-helix domain-containing protein [Clostridiales bacterium]|nr:helix-turn-helix domain-containing protein [Clostridiales bacterium]
MNQETIGKNIRKARRDLDMTQDALAERLAVTESAVSQWESGKTVPDLMIVPALCAVLGVTSDWLLGVDAEKRREEVGEIKKQADALGRNGKRKEELAILEEAFRQYPESTDLKYSLMYATDDPDLKITLGEQLLAESTEEAYRTGAMQQMIYSYQEKGNLDRAEELARQMPGLWTTSDVFLTHIARGKVYEERARNLRFLLLNLLYEAMHYGIVYGDDETEASYSDEDRAQVAEKCIAMFKLFFENGDCAFHHGSLEGEYTDLAKWHARRGETDDAIDCLGKAADHALAFIDYVQSPLHSYRHTSLLFRGATGGGDVGLWCEQNSASNMLDRMKKPDFNNLRALPAYREIEARLAAAAGNWHVAEA